MRRSVSRNSPDCAKCARDVSAHVTRPIDNSTPYDQATPPPPPPNNIRTQTPRSSGGVKGLPATDVPRQTAACPHTPRPADHLVARDDLHYDNRKPGPSSGKEATLAPSSQNTQDSLKQNTSVPVTKPLSLFDTTKSDHLQDIVPERPTTPRYNKPQPARYRGVDNMPAITMTAPRLPMFPKAAPKPRPAKLDLAPLVVESVENPNIPRRQLSWSARVRKRRNSIFDDTFNFWAPSRRKRAHSPPVSPRTSIALSDSGSPTPTPDEPYNKRQRVETSESKAATSPKHNSASSDRRFASAGLEEDIARISLDATSSEAHPGSPVDFSTTSYFTTQPERGRSTSQHPYPSYLEHSREHSPSLDPNASLIFAVPIDQYRHDARELEEELAQGPRMLGLGHPLPIRSRSNSTSHRLSTDSTSSEGLPSRSHSTTSSQRPSIETISSIGSSTLVNSSTRGSDSHADRFLNHVRASQEARRRRSTEDRRRIFVKNDENDNWLLGDEPL
ncbi:hypothetical protein HBI56_189730 [Parastagonospora nodorum]|uniref:Uncharacterized protein n=1 Tax=Phaeosphaeria nodorum (strain SN15 / ATCC MYA-4574 / FGSC 10173) TaxID=321614 RepID=A0A7U2I2Y6_PHANO|nr:hypothetical protein HBH56_144730 [Parastagonospora nodorum]QRD01386.1 hypothetical protein JI435_120570 [Parastagonospora nodorum SN15]KAH3927603.1 hypothetical protein HBH54_149920 [Parastagonospora nodorum]KAH3948000.1 hypothetical protein HBH53_109960 [Parastagonospora nodorum]KAH3960128.1 hypothetical protein HBH51_193780 [Parastagonospora nodorum]